MCPVGAGWVARSVFLNVLLTLCLCARITNSQQGQQCRTPAGKEGVCTDIKLCPYMLEALLVNRTASSEQYLRDSLCTDTEGSTGIHICCDRPSCATDNGQAGACVDHQSCRTRAVSSKGTCQSSEATCCPRRNYDGYISRTTGLPEFGFCGIGAIPPPGGSITSLGQFPWTALLVYRTQQGETERCGGSLLSARYVVTAAHCIEDTLVKVRLGVHNLQERCTDLRGSCPFSVAVESRHIIPSYNKATGKDDLALVKIANPAPYTMNIRPICLPESSLPRALQNSPELTVSGWGISQQLSGSDIDADDSWQTFAKIPLRGITVCQNAWKMWTDILAAYQQQTAPTIAPNAICAGGTFSAELCSQDSGGSVVWAAARGHHVIVAVHSSQVAGCRAPVPAVYTPVLSHLKWISDVLKSHYNIK